MDVIDSTGVATTDPPRVPSIRRVAINTCGGDAPGLNAVLSAATWAAMRNGWEIVGIRRGYLGLFQETVSGQPGLMPLTERAVNRISGRGGTILGTTTRGEAFGGNGESNLLSNN